MYRSVMLPLDGSNFGEHALQLAATIARRSGARLELVHVHTPVAEVVAYEPVTPFRYEGLEKSEREWDAEEIEVAERYLSGQATQVAKELNGATSYKLLNGVSVVPALQQEIQDFNPDLIVMATHGRGGFSRAWLGSVADTLVRHIHKPILLVRAEGDDAAIEPVKLGRVLIPLDGSRLSETIVPHALQLGEGALTSYMLLRIVTPVWTSPEIMSEPDIGAEGALRERVAEAREYLARIMDRMSAETVNVRAEVVVGTAAAATILEYARTREMDVIAMATHGRGGLKRLLLGSVADKVLRGAATPMLLYHPAPPTLS